MRRDARAELAAVDEYQARVRASERDEAARLLEAGRVAYYCAGAGRAVVACGSLAAWDAATAPPRVRPLAKA